MVVKVTHSLSAGPSKRQKRILYVARLCLLCVALLTLMFRRKPIVVFNPETSLVLTGPTTRTVAITEEPSLGNETSAAASHRQAPTQNVETFFDRNNTTIHPSACSNDQLSTVKKQLRPEKCERSKNTPWMQRCSFTLATRCPDPVWLHEFHRNRTGASFLSYFIGCNKAIDAVNALRMGSNNPAIDVLKWQEQLQKGGATFDGSSCAQFDKGQVEITPSNGVNDAQVHCFEPITNTFAELDRTKRGLGWGR